MNSKQETSLWNELSKFGYKEAIAARAWQQIADMLNARTAVPNPVPQPTRPKLIAWETFMGLMAAADVLKMFTYGVLPNHLREALTENNRPVTLAIWRGLKTTLTAPTITAVEAEANKTELDPTWTATVLQPSIAMSLGLPTLTADDVLATVQHWMDL